MAYLTSIQSTISEKLFPVQGGSIGLLEGWHSVRTAEIDKPWTIAEIEERLGGWG